MASFRGLGAGADAAHLGAQQPHAEDVQLLAAHVLLAHVDDTLHSEERADGSGGNAMLSRAGLGDDAPLAHPPRQHSLAQRVVDLVRAGVQQVLALEVDLRSAELFAHSFGKVERGGTAAVVVQQIVQLGVEGGVGVGRGVGLLQLLEGGHQGLRHIAPAIDAEAARARGDSRTHRQFRTALTLIGPSSENLAAAMFNATAQNAQRNGAN